MYNITRSIENRETSKKHTAWEYFLGGRLLRVLHNNEYNNNTRNNNIIIIILVWLLGEKRV